MDARARSSKLAEFSAKFSNELDKSKSVVASPLSAEYLLALLTLGSSNEVNTELLDSLGFPDDESIRSSFTEVSSKLKAIEGVTLNVANKVYIMDGPYELNPLLKADAENVFDAGIEKLDFSKAAYSAIIINDWVESKTNNRIKDLISEDSLDSSTRLVLVNALYFKGTWKIQFDPKRTTRRPFHISKSKQINVPMMYMEDYFDYGLSAKLNAQLLKLPYKGEETSMVIVLPGQVDGIDSVLTKLASGYDLIKEIENLHLQKVQVTIPKFKIETEIDLKELLPELGIRAIFDPNNTGLSNLLIPSEPQFVSKALQKAFIEVNEEGAEAAASSAMVTQTKSALPPSSEQFRADRPFFYFLAGADHVPVFVGIYRGDA